jgi:predicted trehalose synthase
MSERRSIQHSSPLKQRLTDEAARLRKEALGVHPGVERERLLKRARRAETASNIFEWLNSRELQPPK